MTTVGLAGCSFGGGQQSSSTPQETPTTATGCETETEVGGLLDTDTRWACPQYRLTQDLYLQGDTTLTVGPGVTVLAEQGVRLVVAEQSALVTEGTADAPVVFGSATSTPGSWGGIVFETDSSDSALVHTDVAHGGDRGLANLTLRNGSTVGLEQVRLREATTYGVIVDGTSGFSSFSTNTFSGNERGVMQVADAVLGDLDADSTYAGGAGPDRIEVNGAVIDDAATWPAVDVPYYFTNTAFVRAPLTIDPGADLTFAEGVELSVGTEGSLSAVGDAATPIVFRGETAAPGFWTGVVVASADAENRLEHVELAHGGNDSGGNLSVLARASMALRRCTVRESLTYGVATQTGATFTEFVENDFRSNEAGVMRIVTPNVGQLDSASTYAGGVGPDRIEVHHENVTQPATWPATDAPLYFAEFAPVWAPVTVEPGAELTFAEETSIDIGRGGSFTADGSEGRISIRGATDVQGFWDGILFETDQSENRLVNCEIANGGYNGGGANVQVASTAVATVRDCLLRDSATYGLIVQNGGQLTASGNQFRNNAEGAIDRQ